MEHLGQTITIDDVAEAAGVSRATVGRVIGNYGSVSEKSRQKVLKAVETLGYRPNAIAQGLRSHNTKTLAVVLGSIKNNYCNALVYAVEKEAMKRGYNVLICNTHEREQLEIDQLQSIYKKQVDGIILSSVYTADHEIPDALRNLYESDVPMVFVDRKIKGIDMDLVQSNNEQASYEATRHLIGLGHRRIGIIGTKDYSTVRERIAGYRRAMHEAGIAVDESIIVVAEYYQTEAGRSLTAELLDNHKGVTALYVLNNTLCSGVLLELKERGMKAPDDISLLAWDDEELNELFDITTIVQPVEETGKLAISRLLDRIENPDRQKMPERIQLETHMVVRKSCGPCK